MEPSKTPKRKQSEDGNQKGTSSKKIRSRRSTSLDNIISGDSSERLSIPGSIDIPSSVPVESKLVRKTSGLEVTQLSHDVIRNTVESWIVVGANTYQGGISIFRGRSNI